MLRTLIASLLLLSLALPGCRRPAAPPPFQLDNLTWDDVQRKARGTAACLAMWGGDEERNRYFQQTVVPAMAAKYGVTLRILSLSDTAEAVNKLLNEKRAGKTAGGSIDAIWINGENFRTAKQAHLLWGPFADRLPNIRFYDEEIRRRDFGTPIEGFEAPWQRAQFVFAFDSARFPTPPDTIEALRQWIKAHPGRFTYVAPPDFTGSAFLRHILIHFGGAASEQNYQRAAAQSIAWLNDIRPYLWKQGETYPASRRDLDRLFANNEIDFTMSYGPYFAVQRIRRGEFPPSTRTFVFRSGTIGNYSFLAIPFNATNVPAALVVINELMSFDRLLDMAKILEDPFPHRLDRLSPEQRAAVGAIPRGPAALPEALLASHYLPEPDAAYLDRFEKEWMEKVLRR
jgi:putative spermidine/putrescine transport system substrate-binding protein